MIGANPPIRLVPHTPRVKSSWQNVEDWERVLSLAGGILMMGKGLRRGGVGGLLHVALGGMALARGISGHCAAQQWIGDQYAEMADIRRRLETASLKLAQLQEAAGLSDSPVAP